MHVGGLRLLLLEHTGSAQQFSLARLLAELLGLVVGEVVEVHAVSDERLELLIVTHVRHHGGLFWRVVFGFDIKIFEILLTSLYKVLLHGA